MYNVHCKYMAALILTTYQRGAAVLPIFKTSTKNGFISTQNNFSTKIFGGCIGNDLKIMRT